MSGCASLYFGKAKRSPKTGFVPKGNIDYAKQTVQSTCISGWYTGWVYVDLRPPPGYRGRTKFSSWSKASRYITC
jgi:hypothetical protein